MSGTVNYKQAIERAGGNTALAKELFAMLLKELPGLREQLRLAIAARDFASCWDHAHKIYGSTAYCAVPTLALTAQATEAAVKAEDLSELEQQFDAMSAAIDELLATGEEHLQSNWET